MPTIDQLEAAVVAADDDTLPVSQGGRVRRVTRSQLLAGTQTSLALTPGLLGRVSAGLGPPQYISVGRNLSLVDGVLNGPPLFSAATLPHATSIGPADVMPVWQDGEGRAVDPRTLLSIGGINASTYLASTVVGATRELGAWFGDAMAVEAFGAIGDGITDDTLAFDAAIASGRPILLGPKVYRIDGQWNVNNSAVLIGTPGLSTLRRISQKGGAWISITGFQFFGVDVLFDAGSITGDSWGVLVATQCTTAIFKNCSFLNATGQTLGTGLTIQARDGLSGPGSSHLIDNCRFIGNACHGLWVQAAAGTVVRDCTASNNVGYGICLDFNDPTFKQQVRQSSITGCRCINNSRGISVGNYNETNSEPPRWGLEHPDAVDIVVSSNYCGGNQRYGISVSGQRIFVFNNQVIVDDNNSFASGILCNAKSSLINDNIIIGPGQYGIDAGGCKNISIERNVVDNFLVGINPGGSVCVDLIANKIVKNKRAITVFQVETDGSGSNFGLTCSDIHISENLISFDAGDLGIALLDGPERIRISNNRFICPTVTYEPNCFWGHSDSISMDGNTWNGAGSVEADIQQDERGVHLAVADILDSALISEAVSKIDVISGVCEAEMVDRVSFIRVSSAGQGYTKANVIITGNGLGAMATAYVRDGAVIGIALTSSGYGYDSATTNVQVVGDGVGARAQAFIGLHYSENQMVTLSCEGSVSFTAAGNLANWTNTSITVPGGTDIVWKRSESKWKAVRFSNNDYLQPLGDGDVSLRSAGGDVQLRPGKSGHIRVCSDLEPNGYLSCLGRGSPEGMVTAPPGSDYRNLDGGAGKTLWFKISGSDAKGWAALA